VAYRFYFLTALLALSLHMPFGFAAVSAPPAVEFQRSIQSTPITLDAALRQALQKNTTIQSATADTQIAKAQYLTRLAEMLPDIRINYDPRHYEGALQGFDNTMFQVRRQSYTPQMIFTFPVFQGGKKWFPSQASKHKLYAQQHQQKLTTQQVLQQTALAYYKLNSALIEMNIAQQGLVEAKAQLEVNEARETSGVGTRLESLQAKTQLARAEQRSLEASRMAKSSALMLNELLDLDSFTTPILNTLMDTPTTLVNEKESLEALTHFALGHREEAAIYNEQLAALKTLRKVAWSALLPDIYLSYRMGGVGNSLDTVKHYDETGYGVNFNYSNLAIPARTRYMENTAQIKKLDAELRGFFNKVEREVAENLLLSASKKSQIAVLQAEVDFAEKLYTDAVVRLKVGVGRNLEVIDAQTKLSEARSRYNQAIYEYNSAQVALIAALGAVRLETLTNGLDIAKALPSP
jgi:outer membrane factor, OMF family